MAGIPFTPVQNGDRTPYGGGGGKLRTRRVTKRNATPYDRPAVGRHASAGPQAAALMNGVVTAEGPGRGTWLGAGLLGTASKMVTNGASYLYSSFFRRRDVPLLLTEAERTPAEVVEGQADASPSAAEAESTEAGSQPGEEDRRLEVESWMKKNIFPREEADRLIEILRSSVADNGTAGKMPEPVTAEVRTSVINQVTTFETTPNNGPQSDAQRWREELTKARQEQKSNLWSGGSAKENGTPTAGGTSEAAEAGDTSVVDLARAYMGERVTRIVGPASRVTFTQEKVVTPLGLSRYQASPYQPSPYQASTRRFMKESREVKLRTPPGVPFSSQLESPPVARSLGLPPPVAVRGVRDVIIEDKLRTPPITRTLGRLPLPPRTNPPGSAVGFPLPGEGSKKRSSSALEDGGGYSSVGPIRRLRPRSSLYTPSPASGSQRRGGMGMYAPPVRTLQTPMEVKEQQTVVRTWGVEKEGRNIVFGNEQKKVEEKKGVPVIPAANVSVPERASETARKILETLDMMTPSPKEKSLDTELALVRERPPTELTTSMMNEQALKTMQTWDFPKPQQGEEAGPSGRGRNLENDLSSAGGSPWKGTDHGTKSRGKGKAPVSVSKPDFLENSPDHSPDRSGSFFEEMGARFREAPLPTRSKLEWDASQPVAGSPVGKNKGFQINADVDDSDEESRGAVSGLNVESVTTTSTFVTVKSSTGGAVFFDSDAPKATTIRAPVFGGPATSESQTPDTDWTPPSSDSKLNANFMSGGFTFPSSTTPGTSLEPPPTPKPFPSPALTGPAPAAMNDGLPTFNFNPGSKGDRLVFSLPSGVTSGDQNFDSVKAKFEFKAETKPEFSFGAVSNSVAPQPLSSKDSSTEPVKAAEPAKSDGPAAFNAAAFQSSPFPHVSAASTSSNFSLSSLGAGSQPAFAGVSGTTSTSSPAVGTWSFGNATVSAPGSISSPDTQTPVITSISKTETSTFAFGKTPSASAPSGTSSLTNTATVPGANTNIFGSTNTHPASTPVTTPAFTFSSAPAFAQSKSQFLFGSPPGSTGPAPSTQSSVPSSLVESDRPQKRMFGQEKTQSASDAPVLSTVTFGLTAAASTTMTTTSAPGGFLGVSSSSAPSPAPFFIPSFGQSSSSSTQGSSLAAATQLPPLFGLTHTSTASAPANTTTITPPSLFGSTPSHFGASSGSSTPFGSSAFGTSNTNQVSSFGGASSTPAFGVANANNKPAFGSFSSEVSTQPSTPPSVFSGFGAPANLGPTPSPSTFSFGGPSSAATSSLFAFGASSAASSSAFAFGASSGSSSASPFSFGGKPASSPSMFGGSSAPGFGSSPNGVMTNDGNGENTMEDSMAEEPSSQMLASSPPAQSSLLFGAPQTPGSGTFLFGQQPSTPVATPSPGVFSFGGQNAPAGGNTFTPPAVAANPFATPPQQGALAFPGGGFNLGSSGQDAGAKTTRKIFKAKRTGSVKRK